MTFRLQPRRNGDGGFTLVEMLLAMAIMGILLPTVAIAFNVGLKTTDEASQRYLDSHDVESAAAFVNSDVQNATTVSDTDTSDCVAATFPVSRAALYLAWTDRSIEGSPVSDQVNYYVSNGSLVRSACMGTPTPTAYIVIQDLDSTIHPDVLCNPADCSASVALRGKTKSGQLFSLIGTRRTP